MRIVDRQTFLALPEGTVFQKYAPQFVSDFGIKGETLGSNDFIVLPLDIGFLADAHDSGELCDLYCRMEEGEDFALDFETTQRDGCFDNDQLFAVWSDEDVEGLFAALRNGMEARKGQDR